MSLERKIKDILEMPLTNIDFDVEQCVKICDEFAVGFAEWIIDAENKPKGQFTITELLEIYKEWL